MKKMLSVLRRLWAREPVLAGTVLPVLVTVGVITQTQASTVQQAIAGLVAVAAEVAAAFGVRHHVTPVK